jgi:polysaccharide chain length determinant protein (PEP-CTERM system associated)
MQPTEAYSVARRALDVEDYIDILRRHKGWIFGPFLLTLVASVVGVYLWPDSYISQSVVKVVPQQLPQTMVPSAINQLMTDRINSMSQTIMSRTVLTTIINTFGLYQRERSRLPIEDVIEQMRKAIQIMPVQSFGAPGREVPAFVVQFSYENRYTAQKVTQDLVSRFIDENVRNRTNQVFITSQFLKDQVDTAKKDLDEIENKLTSFRIENNGRLPDQVSSNMSQMQALQINVTALDNSIQRAEQTKLQLETELRIARDQLANLQKDPTEILNSNGLPLNVKSERLLEAERNIQSLDQQLAVYRQRYTEGHPDVELIKDRLALEKKRRDEIAKEDAANYAKALDELKEKIKKEGPRPPNPAVAKEQREIENNIQRIQSAVESKNLEIEGYNKEIKRASEAVKSFQGRIEAVPVGERQFGDLTRDRELAKERFITMQENYNKAQVAQEMEGRKQGETLELLDPASLPQNPTEPKRPMIISIGAGLGLLLGIVFAGAREMKDTSLKNLKDVRAYTQMAILGSIPLLENDFVVRRRKRMAWLGWTTSSLAAAVIIAGSIVYYYVTKV